MDADESTMAKLGRGLVAGLVAGAVAGFAMDRFQAAVSALSPSDDDAEPATEQAADGVARSLSGAEVPGPDKPLAGQAIHYALGIAMGVGYAVAAEFRPQVAAGRGAAFGIGTATLLDQAAVPAAGLGDPPWQSDAGTIAYSYVSHLVFAGVLDLVRRQIRGTLLPSS